MFLYSSVYSLLAPQFLTSFGVEVIASCTRRFQITLPTACSIWRIVSFPRLGRNLIVLCLAMGILPRLKAGRIPIKAPKYWYRVYRIFQRKSSAHLVRKTGCVNILAAACLNQDLQDSRIFRIGKTGFPQTNSLCYKGYVPQTNSLCYGAAFLFIARQKLYTPFCSIGC